VIHRNPLATIRLPRGKTVPKQVLEPEQVEALIAALKPAYRPFALVLAWGGLRPGEAAALERRHLDDLGQLLVEQGQTEAYGQIEIAETKTRRARVVKLPASVARELAAHLETRPAGPRVPMFTDPGGGPLRLSRFREALRKAQRDAGLPAWVTAYTLRHTCASLMARQGVPVSTAAARLGDDPAMYLRTYAHAYPSGLDAAADALESVRSGQDAGIARGRRLRRLSGDAAGGA
jgi:integrase